MIFRAADSRAALLIAANVARVFLGIGPVTLSDRYFLDLAIIPARYSAPNLMRAIHDP
jgi:hypothetical protein